MFSVIQPVGGYPGPGQAPKASGHTYQCGATIVVSQNSHLFPGNILYLYLLWEPIMLVTKDARTRIMDPTSAWLWMLCFLSLLYHIITYLPSYSSGGQKFTMPFVEWKSKHQQPGSLWRLCRRIHILTFFCFWTQPAFLGLWYLPFSSKHSIYQHLPPSYKDTCDYIGPPV